MHRSYSDDELSFHARYRLRQLPVDAQARHDFTNIIRSNGQTPPPIRTSDRSSALVRQSDAQTCARGTFVVNPTEKSQYRLGLHGFRSLLRATAIFSAACNFVASDSHIARRLVANAQSLARRPLRASECSSALTTPVYNTTKPADNVPPAGPAAPRPRLRPTPTAHRDRFSA